ncbi:M48 family metallopeptidase [Pseudomonas sp. NFACC02]|uniref:M48 family metallopeptidase n=1 Tax=Pseudomonas sp. NFACC02 TaxID=1566250 RepID=UPI000B86794B|nr:M48 family metallopeptidase [Pseudomonas sp. NFACC02]
MRKMKLVVLLILLPVLLGLSGAWELQRSTDSYNQLVRHQAELANIGVQLREMASQDKNAWIEINDRRVSVDLAMIRFGKAEDDNRQVLVLTRVTAGIAWSVVILGFMAALVGSLGLLSLAWAGSRALESRERLLHSFTRVSRVLPFVLSGHIFAMAAAVAAILIYEGLGLWHAGRMSPGELKLMAAAFITGLVCLYSIWAMGKQLKVMLHMFKPTAMVVLGQSVTPEQAPLLWDFVRDLAQRLDALQPDHIVLGMSEGFYVTSSEVNLLPCDAHLSGRTLHVPIVYLGLLDEAQTRAVIGHELAHFVGADTEYSQRFLPIYDGISRSLEAIFQTMLSSGLLQRTILRPALMLGMHFMESFDHAVNHWGRVRELAADAAGAQVASNIAIASALLRISALEPILQERLGKHVGDATNPRPGYVMPTNLPSLVLHELSDQVLTLPEEELATQLAHPSDTHPSNGERIASLQVTVDEAVRSAIHPVDAVQACAAMDRYFVAPQQLHGCITETFLGHYVALDAETVEQLRAYASKVSSDLPLHEGGRVRGIITLIIVGLVFLAGAGLLPFAWLYPEVFKGQTSMVYIIGGVLMALAAIGLPYTLRLVLRADTTALLLTPDHFVFANLKAPLPIEHINDFGLHVGKGIMLNLLLEDDAPMPELISRSFFAPGARLNKKSRWVQLQLVQFCRDNKKLKIEELAELIGTYLASSTARRILQERFEQATVNECPEDDLRSAEAR